jgi:4a-hydroxytetrahydrobiopterin dehydratase
MGERVYSRQFHAAAGAEAWRVLPEGAYAFFRTDSFGASARFVQAINALLRDTTVAPHVDIRGDGVMVLLRAFRAEYGLFDEDLELARAISTAARELELTADPTAIQTLSMIPGAPQRKSIMPFWQAVLAYVPRPDSPDEDLVDPHDRLAPFWFEEMDELRPDGKGSIHFVVWVPWDQAEARVAAALSAGGRIVTYHEDERYWTMADPVGNEVDIAATSPPETTSEMAG